MTAKKALEVLLKSPLVPLFNHGDAELCKKVIKICYDEGVQVFEFPYRLPNALEVFKAIRAYSSEHLPGMLLGAGTIKTASDAELFIREGADFLISPSISLEVSKVCKASDILWIPGCATPTEITLAESLGIALVKIFPATQLGGPAFIKAMKGPFPGMKYMASGGVGTAEEELRQWFAAGVSNVAITSHLFKKEMLEEPGHQQLSANVRKTFSLLKSLSSIA